MAIDTEVRSTRSEVMRSGTYQRSEEDVTRNPNPVRRREPPRPARSALNQRSYVLEGMAGRRHAEEHQREKVIPAG